MENNSNTKIVKSTIIYLFGGVFSKIIVFFMLPIYTKYISAADMGLYDTNTALVAFFSSVVFLDIGSAILRFMFEKKGKEYEVISTGIVIFFISLTVYLGLAIGLYFIYKTEYFVLMIILGIITAINSLYGYVVRGFNKGAVFALSGILATAINVLLNIVLIVCFKFDYSALYISSCISLLAQIVWLEISSRLVTKIKAHLIDKTLFKNIFKFCLPLCLNSVAYWMLTSINKVIVTNMLGAEQNGYLTIANRLTSIMYLLSTCFQLAWQDLSYSKENNLNNKSTGEFYSKAVNLYIKTLLVGVLCSLPLIGFVFPFVINSAYASSKNLIPLALLGTVFSILSSFLGSIFVAIKKPNFVFLSTVIGAIVNICAIFICMALGLGAQSSNIAFLLGYIVNDIIRIVVIGRYFKFSVNWLTLTAIFFVYIVSAFIFMFNWYINLIALVISIAVGFFILRKEIFMIINSLVKNKKKL